MDAREQTERRCEAIENLYQRSVTFDKHLIRTLLSDDDGTVSRYALGLVPTSPGREALLTAALESPHASDSAFVEELTLLKQMIEDEE